MEYGDNILDSIREIGPTRRGVRVYNSNVFQEGMTVDIESNFQRLATMTIAREDSLGQSITFTEPLPESINVGMNIVMR